MCWLRSGSKHSCVAPLSHWKCTEGSTVWWFLCPHTVSNTCWQRTPPSVTLNPSFGGLAHLTLVVRESSAKGHSHFRSSETGCGISCQVFLGGERCATSYPWWFSSTRQTFRPTCGLEGSGEVTANFLSQFFFLWHSAPSFGVGCQGWNKASVRAWGGCAQPGPTASPITAGHGQLSHQPSHLSPPRLLSLPARSWLDAEVGRGGIQEAASRLILLIICSLKDRAENWHRKGWCSGFLWRLNFILLLIFAYQLPRKGGEEEGQRLCRSWENSDSNSPARTDLIAKNNADCLPALFFL